MDQEQKVKTCSRCGFEFRGEDCPECKAAETPFYRKNLKKDDEAKLLLTLRLNKEERAQLDLIKEALDLSSDGAALKLAAFKGWGVLQRTLGAETLRWLSSKDRLTRGGE